MRIEHQNIFFTSDYHIGHNNVIRFDNRPFENLHEMHEVMIEKWNSVVNDDSIIFYLGDYIYKGDVATAKWFSSQIKGRVHFLMGNHDRYKNITSLKRFEKIYGDDTTLGGATIQVRDQDCKDGWQSIVMCHYPILSWNKQHHSSWHIHGHCHQNLYNNPNMKWFYDNKVIDAGCNGWDYTPISYQKVKEVMDLKLVANIDSQKSKNRE